MKHFPALFILLAFFLSACNQPTDNTATDGEESEGFTFAFLTDIHLQPEKKAIEGFQKAIDTLNKINPDFIVTGGDLVMDVLDQSFGRADSLYKLYEEVSGGLKMPVYNTVGNHEVYGWHRDEDGIEEHPEYGKGMFESRMGNRYYSFDHKGWHFMILDAIQRNEEGRYYGGIDDEQLEWIKQDLQDIDKETPIVISAHIPFITARTQLTKGALAPNSEGTVITNARDVLLELYEYNLKLVLQGHLHFLEDIYLNNDVHFITAGAVSGRWWSNKPEDPLEEGFLLVHVEGGEIQWEYVDFGWTPEI